MQNSKQAAQLANTAAAQIAELSGVITHDIALTLGSGWGQTAAVLGETISEIPAATVAGFHSANVPGHAGTLRSVLLPNGKHVLIIGARSHYYESRNPQQVVHGVRVAHACGARTMVLTCGAGGINPAYQPGEAVLISDHLNLTGATPLSGAHFVDLTDLYSQKLRDLARTVEPGLREGVYAQFAGPQYETPAEVRYAAAIGGDIVGMSVALEAIMARAIGLEVLGLSLITNLAAGIQSTPLNHAEVLAAGQSAEVRLAQLLRGIVQRL